MGTVVSLLPITHKGRWCVCLDPGRSDSLLAVQFHGSHADDFCFQKEKKEKKELRFLIPLRPSSNAWFRQISFKDGKQSRR